MWVGMQALINIGVNMGVLPTKGLTLPFMSYGRSSLLVTLAWFGVVLRVHHEASVVGARLGQRMPPRGGLRNERRDRCSSWPAAPAATCSRRWRWRDCCARIRATWCGWARGVASRRAWCRPRDFAIEWLSVGGLRGKGLLTLLAAPFRLLRALLQALAHHAAPPSGGGGGPGRIRHRTGRTGRLAVPPAAGDPRAERHRRLHQSLPGATWRAKCFARFPSAFPAQRAARVIGNPVRADIAALPAPAAALRRTRRVRAPAGRRRQPGRGAPERGGAAGAGAAAAAPAARCNSTVRHQAGEKHLDAAQAAYRRGGRARRGHAPSSPTWPRPWAGRTW